MMIAIHPSIAQSEKGVRMKRFLIGLSFVAASSLTAQIPDNAYLTFTSVATEQQLSALPGQRLGLSPNKGPWEQWQYVPVAGGHVLRSAHGTNLVVTLQSNPFSAYHAPEVPMQGIGVSGLIAQPNLSGRSENPTPGRTVVLYSSLTNPQQASMWGAI